MISRVLATFALVTAALVSVPPVSGAQTDTGRAAPPAGAGRAGRASRGFAPRAGRGQGVGVAGGRGGQAANLTDKQAAIRLVRQAMARRYRRQLNLNDDQMRTLQRTDQQYERQRQDIMRGERQARQGLKAAMQDSVRDQSKIAQYIDQLTLAQHKRADLLDAEQKDLSTFLTPMQRAQYLSLKEQLDKRIQQLQQNGVPPAGGKPDSIPPER